MLLSSSSTNVLTQSTLYLCVLVPTPTHRPTTVLQDFSSLDPSTVIPPKGQEYFLTFIVFSSEFTELKIDNGHLREVGQII